MIAWLLAPEGGSWASLRVASFFQRQLRGLLLDGGEAVYQNQLRAAAVTGLSADSAAYRGPGRHSCAQQHRRNALISEQEKKLIVSTEGK